jgi:hypothetical protein
MTEPTPPPGTNVRQKVQYPLRTKIVVVVVLFVAVGGFVLAGLRTDSDLDADDVTVSGTATTQTRETISNGVEGFTPRRGAEALAQAQIILDLAPGWQGELVLQPESGEAIPLPDDEVEFTSLNELRFQPGEGKSVERLPTGQNCVRATIWDQVRGRGASERVETWCFDVT